ncbi:MAG: VOC family protein [Desulfobacterales bacterium]
MADDAKSKLKMRTVDHIGIVVKDARKVAAAWESMMGIGPWTFTETGGATPGGEEVKVLLGFAYSENGVELELIEIAQGRILHSDFLDLTGGGLHHLAYIVDDVDGEAAKLVAEGAEIVLSQPGAFAYLRFEDDGGVIFELMKGRATP